MTSKERPTRAKKPTPTSPPKKPQALTKTKRTQEPKQTSEAKRVADMKAQAETVLDEVYGKGGDRDDPGDVIAALAFDSAEVHQLAEYLADAADDLKPTSKVQQQDAFKRNMDRLQDRLKDSRELAGRIERIEQVAVAAGADIALDEDLATADLWDRVQAELVAPESASTGVGRVQKVTGTLAEIESLLGYVDTILTTINGRPGAAPIGKVPEDLLRLMGVDIGEENILGSLKILQYAVTQEPDPDRLRGLLTAADFPVSVPKLISDTRAVGADLLAVLQECRPPNEPGQPPLQGQAALEGNTELAEKLLKTIADSGQNATYFLTGAGGQRLVDLKYAANAKAPVWAGTTVARNALRFGPLYSGPLNVGAPHLSPSVPFAQIRGLAEQLPVGQQVLPPLPGGVVRDRYVGGGVFGNIGAENGMILPKRNHATKAVIGYREYDVRPFTALDERGAERVVVGSDGNQYYTADHYKTFRRMT
jgi:hypothetical protein